MKLDKILLMEVSEKKNEKKKQNLTCNTHLISLYLSSIG